MIGSPDAGLAALHAVEYGGLLGAIGSMVVMRLAHQRPLIRWADPPMHRMLGIAFGGGLGLTVVESILSGAPPGWAPVARVAAEGIAWFLCVRGIPIVAPVTVLAAGLLPFAGHAAQVGPGAELADALHVLSAGMWAGGILALATLRPPEGWRGAEARMLVDRFSGVALVAFGITALTGVLRAGDQLRDVSALWTTSYGEVLALKSAGVGIMLILSTLAWRRGLPLARLEAAAMVLVVAATAVLAAYPARA